MPISSLNLKINDHEIPKEIIECFWKFFRQDISVNEFVQFIYTESRLYDIFDLKTYEQLIFLDYADLDQLPSLRRDLFNFLLNIKLNCLCVTLPDATIIYPYCDSYKSKLKSFIEVSLETQLHVKDFGGNVLAYWFHDAIISKCKHCGEMWFMSYEESEADHYLLRLSSREYDLLISNDNTLTQTIPPKFRKASIFFEIKFEKFSDIYYQENDLNILLFETLQP